MPSTKTLTKTLCLNCGLCCNGVLFKDVVLQDQDDVESLEAAGLTFKRRGCGEKRSSRLPQPCAALGQDLYCRVYATRPARCHDFECALFQSTRRGETTVDAALRIIRRARSKAGEIERLLRRLGDQSEALPLSFRFRRLVRRMESGKVDATQAGAFAELTVAMHELNVLLSRSFYS